VVASSTVDHPLAMTVLTTIGVGMGGAVALITRDVILGVITGAGFVALTVQGLRVWTGGHHRR
jgi:hypothetical protein